MDWERLPASRWRLRQLGVLLLLGAYTAGKHMLAIGAGHHGGPAPLVYLLALITFLCASAGSALLIHGHHLFDKIQVSERWQRRPPARPEMTPDVPPGQKAIEVPAEIMDASRVISNQANMSEKPRFGVL